MVDRLIKANVETYVLVSGFRSNTHPSILNRDAFVIKGDLRDYGMVEKATENMDFVFHLASILSHYCDVDPEATIDVNIKGTWNLQKACARNMVERIIFASTSFVYGEPQQIPVNEEHPTPCKDILGITKLAGEKILQSTYPSKIGYTILRMFNVYGPRQYPDKLYTAVVPTWITLALKKQSLEIHDDGSQRLDFVYVEDVADAFIACLRNCAENQIFNVGSGTVTSMNSLASLINKITENPAPPHYNQAHPAYFKRVQSDIKKIENLVGWVPKVSLSSGLEKTVNFFKGEKRQGGMPN